ncbi:Putative pre-16S rRNA nuclease YqgF [Candidatus Syntrophocurvum alkaliphilum]|uniref:Putative pre-16S rRNA nuclease n=1 Tax=Candidatus Syntrophocurvum alkaliphilum TaxID=2293317 RepID=A0A6I6DC34_9FIRM|nr:Holliday junction resolvase RuvX [Candidatus Syntrophocurvum alkaliphilum]QGT98905.1 Putative pre-16S rRNA nuclease YqgF [Candidatus Syntrophocurvum alkaliphilum]
MRIIGLDVGDKRIGIAISDPMGWTAQPHSVLTRKNIEKDLDEILKICKEYEVNKIIVGLPLNMNGSYGPKASEITNFSQQLEEYSKISIEYIDERLTTKSAERVLIDADISRKKRKQVIDKIAAQNILQIYLDRLNR